VTALTILSPHARVCVPIIIEASECVTPVIGFDPDVDHGIMVDAPTPSRAVKIYGNNTSHLTCRQTNVPAPGAAEPGLALSDDRVARNGNRRVDPRGIVDIRDA